MRSLNDTIRRTARKVLRAAAGYDPKYYDMYADPDEAAFASLYLERIRRRAEAAGIRPPAIVLEAGCQAGRLAIPLAKAGFRVTGVDASGFALRRARANARRAGVRARFIRGDILNVLRDPRHRYDIVICAEVLYLSPRYREILAALARAVNPGGLLCVSHRPKMYYLLEALRHGKAESARRVLNAGEGSLDNPGSAGSYFNWQTDQELRVLYGALGLGAVEVYPIDQVFWLSGVAPSGLEERARSLWLAADLAVESVAGGPCSRYALVIASKKNDQSD